jgi:hypothetical protein
VERDDDARAAARRRQPRCALTVESSVSVTAVAVTLTTRARLATEPPLS